MRGGGGRKENDADGYVSVIKHSIYFNQDHSLLELKVKRGC